MPSNMPLEFPLFFNVGKSRVLVKSTDFVDEASLEDSLKIRKMAGNIEHLKRELTAVNLAFLSAPEHVVLREKVDRYFRQSLMNGIAAQVEHPAAGDMSLEYVKYNGIDVAKDSFSAHIDSEAFPLELVDEQARYKKLIHVIVEQLLISMTEKQTTFENIDDYEFFKIYNDYLSYIEEVSALDEISRPTLFRSLSKKHSKSRNSVFNPLATVMENEEHIFNEEISLCLPKQVALYLLLKHVESNVAFSERLSLVVLLTILRLVGITQMESPKISFDSVSYNKKYLQLICKSKFPLFEGYLNIKGVNLVERVISAIALLELNDLGTVKSADLIFALNKIQHWLNSYIYQLTQKHINSSESENQAGVDSPMVSNIGMVSVNVSDIQSFLFKFKDYLGRLHEGLVRSKQPENKASTVDYGCLFLCFRCRKAPGEKLDANSSILLNS